MSDQNIYNKIRTRSLSRIPAPSKSSKLPTAPAAGKDSYGQYVKGCGFTGGNNSKVRHLDNYDNYIPRCGLGIWFWPCRAAAEDYTW